MLRSCLLPKRVSSLLIVFVFMFFCSACEIFSSSPSPSPLPPPLEPENQPPVIHSVIADQKEVMASNSCQLVCEATDAEGDDLSYWWSADEGMIKGESDNVTWIAPDIAGDHAVRVMVADGKGGETTGSVIITVELEPNEPPVISGLTRDGEPVREEEKLRVWRTTTIKCIAEDPNGDELNFIWSATGGRVQGEGAEVGWTAPGVADYYTVTVTVTDGRGGEAEVSMDFNVLCCGQ